MSARVPYENNKQPEIEEAETHGGGVLLTNRFSFLESHRQPLECIYYRFCQAFKSTETHAKNRKIF